MKVSQYLISLSSFGSMSTYGPFLLGLWDKSISFPTNKNPRMEKKKVNKTVPILVNVKVSTFQMADNLKCTALLIIIKNQVNSIGCKCLHNRIADLKS